jgi:asparagine synthase (glutamine-hydrolysing)
LLDLAKGLSFTTIATEWGKYIRKHKRFPPLRGGFRAGMRRWIGRRDQMNAFPQWLAPHFERKLNLRERWRALHQNGHEHSTHPWYPSAHRVLNSGSWASAIEVDDSAWSAVPVDSRSPFLDSRILRFLLRVPPIPLCVDKELLRRITLGYLPDEIRLRPKVPLAGDPLALLSKCGRWSPIPLPTPAPSILAFIDWEKLALNLRDYNSESAWRDLAPITLLYWLKSIEKRQGIQYIECKEYHPHDVGARAIS